MPPTRYISGLGVEKGGTNRIADTICPVRPGSRPNCAGFCGGGCTNQVKMGPGRVVHPTPRCPPPDISQDWVSKKGERTESPTRYVPCAWGRAPTVQDTFVKSICEYVCLFVCVRARFDVMSVLGVCAKPVLNASVLAQHAANGAESRLQVVARERLARGARTRG